MKFIITGKYNNIISIEYVVSSNYNYLEGSTKESYSIIIYEGQLFAVHFNDLTLFQLNFYSGELQHVF